MVGRGGEDGMVVRCCRLQNGDPLFLKQGERARRGVGSVNLFAREMYI